MARMKPKKEKKKSRLADSTAHISPLKTIGARKRMAVRETQEKRGMAPNDDNNSKNDSSQIVA